VTRCDTCGKEFDELEFLVVVPGVRARFHSYDCAQKGYRRFLAEQHLVVTYGPEIAALMRRQSERDDDAPWIAEEALVASQLSLFRR
jgi:hypothetical protein